MDVIWNVELYETQTGEKPVNDYLESLPTNAKAKVYREIDLLEEVL